MALYEIDGSCPSFSDKDSSFIAPSADLIGDVRIGQDASVWFHTVIRADNTPIVIGDRTNIQENCVLHADPGLPLVIGADCTIGHHVTLHGCSIGDRVLVGMGATVLNGATVGDDCIVGAGALITEAKAFAPQSLILGSPATVKRTLSDLELAELRRSADHYVANQRRFSSQMKEV